MDLLSLHGKTAVVTGGAKDIGAATVRTLEQARVVAFDVEALNDLAFGGLSVDVTRETAVKEAFSSSPNVLAVSTSW